MNPETSHGKHLETMAVVQKCHRVAVSVDAGDQKCTRRGGKGLGCEVQESPVQRGAGGAPLSEVGMDGAWNWV